jgi:hypothetical protein
MSDPSGLYSTASTIADKIGIQKISDALKSGVGKISDALGSATKKATSFPVNDKKATAPTSSSQKRPEEVRPVKYQGALTFPAELKYFTMFTFKKYKRVDIFEDKKELSDVTIILPVPSNISENFGVTYDTPALGPIAGQLGDTAIAIGREMAGQGGTQDYRQRIQDTNAAMAKLSGAQGAYVLARSAVTSGNETGILDRALGVIPNPHLATVFSNVGLRQHSFSYRLIPSNAKELETIKKIIYNFKTRMLPGLLNDSNFLFTFPATCEIKMIAGNKDIVKMKECVLESLNINYSPNGPAFFKTGDPVEVVIDMVFKEVSVFTREDVEPLTTMQDAPNP